jgi:MFS family permease
VQTVSPVSMPTAQEQSDALLYRKVFWRFVPLFVACFVLSYLDRINISFAKLQMQSELGFSDAVYGFGASIFFVGYFLFEVPSNIILHKVGAKRWIARIMITWGIASASMMFVRTETWFYLLRFLIGALEAGFVPGALYFFTKWFPSARRGRINSFFMASIALCGIIGSPISGAIMKFCDGLNGLAGWQWLFLLEGIPSVILGCVVLMLVDDDIDRARWLDANEKRALHVQVTADPKAGELHSIRDAFKEPVTLLMAVIYLFLAMGIYGLVFWMPQLIKTAGTTDTFAIGLISMLPYGVAGVGMILIGRHSDRTGERRWHLGACAIAGAIRLCTVRPVPCQHGHARPGADHSGDRHHHVAWPLLDPADPVPERHCRGERHRADQRGRAIWRDHQPLHGGQGEDGDRQRDPRAVCHSARVRACRRVDPVGPAPAALLRGRRQPLAQPGRAHALVWRRSTRAGESPLSSGRIYGELRTGSRISSRNIGKYWLIGFLLI